MISVNQALEIVLSQTLPREVEVVALRHAPGRILAAPVKADRDAPPFDRVTMDGIAIHAASLSGQSSFKIENIQPAGAERSCLVDKACCIEVMTGAILPKRTDCVIPYEQVEIKEGVAKLIGDGHAVGQNIHFKGTDAKKQDILLDEGLIISPSVIGVLASVGMAEVKVLKLPKVAICSTGDELVDVEEQPKSHQIRKSNSYMLEAALREFGLKAELYHLADHKESMTRRLSSLINKYPIILFSGAVSKGKYDFLPEVLEKLGMDKKVHGVAQRPGKPFLFGTLQHSLIFGFPGNPSSTLVCFHTYFKPWLRQYLGLHNTTYTAVLDREVVFNKPLTYHLLVNLSIKNGRLIALPIKNSGSGDLVHLAQADAVLSLPPDKEVFVVGEYYPLNLLRKDLLYL